VRFRYKLSLNVLPVSGQPKIGSKFEARDLAGALICTPAPEEPWITYANIPSLISVILRVLHKIVNKPDTEF
jgi:hypothetical protein